MQVVKWNGAVCPLTIEIMRMSKISKRSKRGTNTSISSLFTTDCISCYISFLYFGTLVSSNNSRINDELRGEVILNASTLSIKMPQIDFSNARCWLIEHSATQELQCFILGAVRRADQGRRSFRTYPSISRRLSVHRASMCVTHALVSRSYIHPKRWILKSSI